jgi:hypothetical protein
MSPRVTLSVFSSPILALALALALACSGGEAGKAEPGPGGSDSGGVGEESPPPICNSAVEWAGEAAFSEETAAWGLEGVLGTRFSAADVDQDGYPDLIASEGTAFGRDDFEAGTRYHWLLMNRPAEGGGRTFVDETLERGLFAPRVGDANQIGRASVVHVFGDVDNDGDLDVFAGQFYDGSNAEADPGDRNELLLNQGDGTFVLAPQSDLFVDDGYATTGASFTDVDQDGKLDLYVVGWYHEYGYLYAEQQHLYLGQGDGTFTDITGTAGLFMKRGTATSDWLDGEARRPAFAANACDLDGDAAPDLLASNYGRAWNQQWMNDGAALFTEVGQESGAAADDKLDYSDNQFYLCYCSVYGCDPSPEAPAFDEATCATYASYWVPGWDDQPARLAGNTFTTVCGDIDNDGDNDLYNAEIKHWHIGESSDASELLLNDGAGTFTRPGNDTNGLAREWASASWNEGDLFAAFLDFDNDGWKDILLVTTDYPGGRMFLYRQVAPGAFEEVAEPAGIALEWPAGGVVADFDRDGDLDVVTGSSTSRSGTPWTTHEVHLFENGLGGGNMVRIKLAGEAANRAGIGARVEVTTDDGNTQVQELGGGYGHMGMQHDTELSFGLGASCSITAVEVTWPGGAVDTYADVPANYRVTLVEGGAVEVDWDPASAE